MKNTQTFLAFSKCVTCLCLTFLLSSCGYSFTQSSTILESSKTIQIGNIEQPSMHTWLSFYMAGAIRDEIILRRLAKWNTQGQSDYIINAKMLSFKATDFDDVGYDDVLISSATIVMELSVYDARTGKVIWNSGRVSYSENYENPREDYAIQEVTLKTIQSAFDRLQSAF